MLNGTGISSTTYTAINGYHQASDQLGAVAEQVASGVEGEFVSPTLLVQMEQLRTQAQAQMLVIQTIQDLSQDLLRAHRK